jgi:cyclohexadieny/prephenate dehydrogenase
MSAAPVCEKLTIIGLGLIGSSIARAARKYHIAETIVGSDASDIALTYARSKKIIDIAMNDIATAVRDSRIVIIATPPLAMEQVASFMAPSLARGAIVMDVASVKVPIMKVISRHLPSHVDYVPAHPIAGSEQSGVSAGQADLFRDRRIILSPNEPLRDQVLQLVTRFWGAMGARVEGVPPELHDIIYAHVSHLPQLIAFATRGLIPSAGGDPILSRFLRLGSSNPVMWHEIALLNRDNILAALDRYLDVLWHIKKELSEAPRDQESVSDPALARNALFPAIAASCLVTTVMEAEKRHGVPFARFAGTGFADITAPAGQSQEQSAELISTHYMPVLALLQEFIQALQKIRAPLAAADAEALLHSLQ